MTDQIQPARRWTVLRRASLALGFAAAFAAGGLLMSGPASALDLLADQPAAATAAPATGAAAPKGAGLVRWIIRRKLGQLFIVVDATPDQKTRIGAIVKDEFTALGPLSAKLRANKMDLRQAMAAPTIDRAAVEQLRAARIAALDEVSKITTKATIDAAEVLTPAQREKLARLSAVGRMRR
jgi:Spy/CpxP family protein refolding chaperone